MWVFELDYLHVDYEKHRHPLLLIWNYEFIELKPSVKPCISLLDPICFNEISGDHNATGSVSRRAGEALIITF